MKIGFLGSVTTLFTHSYVKELAKSHEVFILNTSKEKNVDLLFESKIYNLFQPRKNKLLFIFIKRILKFFKLDVISIVINAIKRNEKRQAHGLSKRLVEIIDKEKPDLIFSFWGTVTFQYISIIRNNYPKLKIIHDVNTYPVREKVSWNDSPMFLEEDAMDFNKIDGLIFSSKIMEMYFIEKVKISNKIETIVFYDSFVNSFYKNKKVNKLTTQSKEPHIIFLGNTNFKDRSIDDVRDKIRNLIDAGIHVHMQEPATGMKRNRFIHIFTPFSFEEITNGKLSNYANKFDGVVLFYNDFKDVRTSISLPTRFVLGMCTGIPIFLEKNKYNAIEELFSTKGIIYLYERESEIIEALNNDSDWRKFTLKCESNYKDLALENRIEDLNIFMNKIVK